MRHCLEPGEFSSCATNGTDILPILQVELRVVELFTPFKLVLVFLFGIRKVELNRQRLVLHLFTIPLLQVPESLLLVTVEDVLSGHVKNLTVVVFNLVHLEEAALFLLPLTTFLCLANSSILRVFLCAAYNQGSFLFWVDSQTLGDCLDKKGPQVGQFGHLCLSLDPQTEIGEHFLVCAHCHWSLPRQD